jgi:hypothetical protein
MSFNTCLWPRDSEALSVLGVRTKLGRGTDKLSVLGAATAAWAGTDKAANEGGRQARVCKRAF